MADEVLGNIYEVITLIALEDFSEIVQPGERVFWHEHPDQVSIEPDLTIGTSSNRPRLLLQVSHTNAEMASQKKFWRNIGEFVDARIALGTNTTIANIVFDSGQKRNLAAASEAIFDGFLEVDRTGYGENLLLFSSEIVPSIVRNNLPISERPAFLRRLIAGQPETRELLGRFAQDLERVLGYSSRFTTGWYSAFQEIQSIRSDNPRIPVTLETSVRRGLGRLLPIETEESLQSVIEATRSNTQVELPAYLNILGLTNRSLIGQRISDREILALPVWLCCFKRKYPRQQTS